MHLHLKLGVANMLDRLGILQALERMRSTHGGLVLALHRVLPDAEVSSCYEPHIAMGESVFRSLLTLLRRDYQVVPLEDLLRHPESTDQRQRVALTFDDGWIDTYTVAYPILLRYEIPATVFVCTDFLNPEASSVRLPEERLALLWKHCAESGELDRLQNDLHKWGLPQSHSSDRRTWGKRIKRLPIEAKLMMLSHLEDVYRVPAATTRSFLNWEEARIMQANGISFGSHTMRHTTLGAEQQAIIEKELAGSAAALRMKLGSGSDMVAFPNGSFDQRTLQVAHRLDYRFGFTTERGLLTRKTNQLAIPRVCLAGPDVTGDTPVFHAPRTRLYLQKYSILGHRKVPDWMLSPDVRLA